jgi:hypothetical protein
LPGRIIGHGQPKGIPPFEIILTESVSDEMLYAMMFEDNGDEVFDVQEDPAVRGDDNLVIIVKFKVIR